MLKCSGKRAFAAPLRFSPGEGGGGDFDKNFPSDKICRTGVSKIFKTQSKCNATQSSDDGSLEALFDSPGCSSKKVSYILTN